MTKKTIRFKPHPRHRHAKSPTAGSENLCDQVSSCRWGCKMAVEMIIDHWDPRKEEVQGRDVLLRPPVVLPLQSRGDRDGARTARDRERKRTGLTRSLRGIEGLMNSDSTCRQIQLIRVNSGYARQGRILGVAIGSRTSEVADTLQKWPTFSYVAHEVRRRQGRTEARRRDRLSTLAGRSVLFVASKPTWRLVALRAKVADRIANVRHAARNRRGLVRMYRKEHEAFTDALYRPGVCDEMWDAHETQLGAIQKQRTPSTLSLRNSFR